ncbi:elongation factor P maturation arginine rhamnosyltransferase EarP [Ideonella sp.]|uniref:elongation factor P maturation arginine rhamnosyltransferase EarP n=1 Tax=Ideonella sp. TaxID=1929293 RepID=UPI003BB528CB
MPAPQDDPTLATPTDAALHGQARPVWDVFCQVIDNYGDVGVCWRLASQLAATGLQIRLWIDDASALQWLAPDGTRDVTVHAWADADRVDAPGEVVIEAFGCDLPAAFVTQMASAPTQPVWINLEYLSAESYVERSHRLRSPQANGLDKWFFYPGFTASTGGLLRETDLLQRQTGFDGRDWLQRRGWAGRPGERVVSLFCYDNPALPALLQSVSEQQDTLVLTPPGPPTRQCEALRLPGSVRQIALPWLSQHDYDHLLWSCDLNIVRGEDSFVRAQWAARPFLWQIYPQHDGVHADKLNAFLDRHLQAAPEKLASGVRLAMQGWNGIQATPWTIPALADWQVHTRHWRGTLLAQAPLAQQLLDFVREKR